MASKLKTKKFSGALEKAANKLIQRTSKKASGAEYIARARLQAQLKALRAEYKQREREYIKQYRHDLSVLKKQGLINKEIQARSAIPNPVLEAARTRFKDVLLGNTSARKVKPSLLQKLREAGFKNVARGRVILPKDKVIRAGKVVELGAKATGRVGERIPLDAENMETQIHDISERLKSNQYIAYEVYGHKGLTLYKTAGSLLRQLLQYNLPKKQMTSHISIYTVNNQEAYFRQSELEAARRQAAKNKRKAKRRSANKRNKARGR